MVDVVLEVDVVVVEVGVVIEVDVVVEVDVVDDNALSPVTWEWAPTRTVRPMYAPR